MFHADANNITLYDIRGINWGVFMNIELPNDMVKLAKSTLPGGVDLDLWIIEWARFGLEVSQKASSRREALEMGVNISDAAKEKFDEIAKNIGTGKGQLLEAVGTQIIDFQNTNKRIRKD